MLRLQDLAIVGVYQTVQARRIPRTSLSLHIEAVKGALADAGLRKEDVDGVAMGWTGPGGSRVHSGGGDWANLLGIRPTWIDDDHTAGVDGLLAMGGAILAGQCEVAIIGGAQAGLMAAQETKTAPWTRPKNEFVQVWGATTPAHFALVARRHMDRYGTTPAQMATVAATIRNHGSVNPEAVMYGRGPYTVEEVLNSRMVASPLRLLDCCLVNEGGAVMILTTRERARDLRRKPVYLLGAGVEIVKTPYAYPPIYEEVGALGREGGRRAFGMAGITHDDLDILELTDPYSFEIIRQFEALGFCGEGEGGPFVESGVMGMDGQFPTATDGGMLSFSNNGVQPTAARVIEAVRQLRQECGPRQVAGAQTALVTTGGSGAQYLRALALGVE